MCEQLAHKTNSKLIYLYTDWLSAHYDGIPTDSYIPAAPSKTHCTLPLLLQYLTLPAGVTVSHHIKQFIHGSDINSACFRISKLRVNRASSCCTGPDPGPGPCMSPQMSLSLLLLTGGSRRLHPPDPPPLSSYKPVFI